VVKTYFNLLQRYRLIDDYDVLMVGYPGHFDVFLAWVLAKTHNKPLAWDVLNSLYLITIERGIQERSLLTVKLIKTFESRACKLPDMLFLDTDNFVDWFAKTHHIRTENFRIVQIGADDRFFAPLDKKVNDNTFRVIYYGTYIPNHGVEYIVQAANLLQDDPSIMIEMIGRGPEKEKATQLAEHLKLNNLIFVDWLGQDDLIDHIANADLVLGTFGITKQQELTNNNKIYEAFAMRKPVISGDSPALPNVLQHEVHLYLCKRGDPKSLAEGIRRLKVESALRQSLIENGEEIVHQYFDTSSIGKRATQHLLELVG
jgi:glycosyltransferase involved in cell wall biosynthesis